MKKTTDSSLYLNIIKMQLPRILSMIDREFTSKTFGCADRLFWSWKFIDFPGPRLQEVSYLLSEICLKTQEFFYENNFFNSINVSSSHGIM